MTGGGQVGALLGGGVGFWVVGRFTMGLDLEVRVCWGLGGARGGHCAALTRRAAPGGCGMGRGLECLLLGVVALVLGKSTMAKGSSFFGLLV